MSENEDNNEKLSFKSNKDKDKVSIDKLENICEKLIDDLEFTSYHIRMVLLLNIYIAGEGFLMVSNSLLTPVLSKVWQLTELQKGFMGGSVFLGFTLGSLFSGHISDKKGRKIAFILGNIISLLGTILSAFSSDVFILCIANFLIGVGLGQSIPSMFSLSSEVTGDKVRNFIINITFVSFVAGEITACFIARKYEVFITGHENWRILLFLQSISFIICIPIILTCHESPKFLFSVSRYEEGFSILGELLDNKRYLLSESTKAQIREQYENFMQGNKSNYKDLFNGANLRVSLQLFVLWYIVSFVYYGLIYILPQIYSKVTMDKNETKELNPEMYNEIIVNIILSCLFEIPTDVINATVPNIKIFGRLRTILIGFIFSFLFNTLSYIHHLWIPILASLSKAMINISFGVLYTYTIEAYPTYMRTTGLGMGNFFSRMGGFTTPIINQYIFNMNEYYPFINFGITSFIGVIITYYLPFETLGRTTY